MRSPLLTASSARSVPSSAGPRTGPSARAPAPKPPFTLAYLEPLSRCVKPLSLSRCCPPPPKKKERPKKGDNKQAKQKNKTEQNKTEQIKHAPQQKNKPSQACRLHCKTPTQQRSGEARKDDSMRGSVQARVGGRAACKDAGEGCNGAGKR